MTCLRRASSSPVDTAAKWYAEFLDPSEVDEPEMTLETLGRGGPADDLVRGVRRR